MLIRTQALIHDEHIVQPDMFRETLSNASAKLEQKTRGGDSIRASMFLIALRSRESATSSQNVTLSRFGFFEDVSMSSATRSASSARLPAACKDGQAR